MDDYYDDSYWYDDYYDGAADSFDTSGYTDYGSGLWQDPDTGDIYNEDGEYQYWAPVGDPDPDVDPSMDVVAEEVWSEPEFIDPSMNVVAQEPDESGWEGAVNNDDGSVTYPGGDTYNSDTGEYLGNAWETDVGTVYGDWVSDNAGGWMDAKTGDLYNTDGQYQGNAYLSESSLNPYYDAGSPPKTTSAGSGGGSSGGGSGGGMSGGSSGGSSSGKAPESSAFNDLLKALGMAAGTAAVSGGPQPLTPAKPIASTAGKTVLTNDAARGATAPSGAEIPVLLGIAGLAVSVFK